jgi:hypothetical protein
MRLYALYAWKDWSTETQCVVKAAGPAADILSRGGFTEEGASGDLQDIEDLTGIASLEPYLGQAKSILAHYEKEFNCIAAALKESLESSDERVLETLPDNSTGTMLVDETTLMNCLNANPTPLRGR